MQVAIYARVSTNNQQKEGTIASQVTMLKTYAHQQGWSVLPKHEYIDDGVSGTRLDRPALDRLRESARCGELDAVVMVSPDRLARTYAHQWLLIEELEKSHTQLIFLHNPFGDTPQGTLLIQMQGIMAEYERAQISERCRRGRLEKARRGEFIPWAYHCYGYQYLPKRHGCAPQVVIAEPEAELVRQMFTWLIEEHLSCRQITKRLNSLGIPTPTRKNQVWHSATVRAILTNRVYCGQARYNYRQSVVPSLRRKPEPQLPNLKTGRRYRPESEWVMGQAPALISEAVFEKAQLQLQRNAELAQKLYRPHSRRYLLRRLVQCGECGLSMVCICQPGKNKQSEYLYYACKGLCPLSCGRTTACSAKRVRADRLDLVVWEALIQLLDTPSLIPELHAQWTQTKSLDLAHITARHDQLLQRRKRLDRQVQNLLDAYQEDVITLLELKQRRQKLNLDLQQIDQEIQNLTLHHHQAIHWQHIIANVELFHSLLTHNLHQLSFEERQAVVQCLIQKVTVTGQAVDIALVLPFDSPPQILQNDFAVSEGNPGHFYRLRLAHFDFPSQGILFQRRPPTCRSDHDQVIPIRQLHSTHPYPLPKRFIRNCHRPSLLDW